MELNQVMTCTIGGASFRLDTFHSGRTPIVKQGQGRTGWTIKADGEGVIEAADAAAFAAAISAFEASCVSGQNFSVTELGSQTFLCAASQCIDGGPHITYQWGENNSVFSRRVSFSLQATQNMLADGQVTAGTADWKTEIEQSPTGLLSVKRTGTYSGTGASDYFTSLVLPTFQHTYSGNTWIIGIDYTLNNFGTSLDFTLTARQLNEPLPGGGAAVDGAVSQQESTDEDGLKTTVISFDMLVKYGQWQAIVDACHEFAEGGTISRESFAFTMFGEQRVRGSIEVLSTTNSNGCISYNETVSLQDPTTTVSERRYSGLDPVIVQEPKGVPRIVQSGRAVGLNTYITAADPLFADTLAEPPQVTYAKLDAAGIRRETTWNYVMLSSTVTSSNLSSLLTSGGSGGSGE